MQPVRHQAKRCEARRNISSPRTRNQVGGRAGAAGRLIPRPARLQIASRTRDTGDRAHRRSRGHPERPGYAPSERDILGGPLGEEGITFAFDFVDPGSYLVHELLHRWGGTHTARWVRMLPLELRPPPRPLIRPESPDWQDLTAAMAELAAVHDILFAPPALVPWTRKAHELVLHGREKGVGDELVDRIFRARFQQGLDLGRVDVLVQVAERAGLDGPEAHTVLGVDRFGPAVEDLRREALATGLGGVPTLFRGQWTLAGLRSAEELRAFLGEWAEERPEQGQAGGVPD